MEVVKNTVQLVWITITHPKTPPRDVHELQIQTPEHSYLTQELKGLGLLGFTFRPFTIKLLNKSCVQKKLRSSMLLSSSSSRRRVVPKIIGGPRVLMITQQSVSIGADRSKACDVASAGKHIGYGTSSKACKVRCYKVRQVRQVLVWLESTECHAALWAWRRMV